MLYPTIKIGKTKKDEINLKINNFILINGEAGTGKSWLAIDLINKLLQDKLCEELTILSWQNKKLYKQDTIQELEVVDYLRDLLEEIKSNNEKYEKTEQIIYYIDGIHLSSLEEKVLFKEIIQSIRFSNHTLIVTTRDQLDESIKPDLIINTYYNKDYYKLLVVHQSVIEDEPVKKVIDKEDYNVEKHFNLIKSLLKEDKL